MSSLTTQQHTAHWKLDHTAEMIEKMHALEVVPATSFIDAYPPTKRYPVAFLDLVVDKQPLRGLFDVPEGLAPVELETTAFRDDWHPKAALEQIDRLLGHLPGDFEDGRVALFLCPVDGDLWCGSVSMEIVRTPHTVIWQQFGWQELGSPVEPELWLFNDQSFSFARSEYEQVLCSLRDHYARQATRPALLRSALRRIRRSFSRNSEN